MDKMASKKRRAHRRKRNFIAKQLHEGRFGPFRPKFIADQKKQMRRDRHNEQLEIREALNDSNDSR